MNLSQFTVQNGASSNLIKVVMMWVHEFIDPEAKDKAAERNETTKTKMVKHDPSILFTIEDLIGIFDLMVGVHESYLPFSYLSEHSINIADITQTILSGNFVMMMMVELDKADISIDELRKDFAEKAEELGVEINIMSEKVFGAMHRI